MIRKYHNQTLQTSPQHLEEEPQHFYSNTTSESSPRQDDCKTRKEIKQYILKQRPTQNPHKQREVHKTTHHQQQNHCPRTDRCPSHGRAYMHSLGIKSLLPPPPPQILMFKHKNSLARMAASQLMQCIITEKQSNQTSTP